MKEQFDGDFCLLVVKVTVDTLNVILMNRCLVMKLLIYLFKPFKKKRQYPIMFNHLVHFVMSEGLSATIISDDEKRWQVVIGA